MKFFCFLTISFVRLFWCFKTSKINNFFIKCYLSLISIIFHPFKFFYSFKSMLVGCFGICSILPVCCFSKIRYSIIRFVSVYMVYLVSWPTSINVSPRKPMRCVLPCVYYNIPIPSASRISCPLPNPYPWPWSSPIKLPRLFVVGKNFFDSVYVNHGQTLPYTKRDCKPYV